MKIDIIEMDDRKAVLDIQDSAPYFVNALRRALIAEVPKLAMEYITFYDNTSGLFDEMVAHRLGLVPLPTDHKLLEAVAEAGMAETEEGEKPVLARFTLSKEGPCTVYSGDLESDNPDVRPADPKIPIVMLLANQRLILETEGVLGTGNEHAKFQPVSGCAYKYYPIVEIDNDKFDAQTKKAVINACSTGVLKDAAGKVVCEDITKINLNDDFEKAYAQAAGMEWPVTDRSKLGIRVRGDDTRFIFRFETDGSMTPHAALTKAVAILGEKFDTLGKLMAAKVK